MPAAEEEGKAMHLSPELVDTVADYLAIFVLFFVPGLLIYVFWMVHILPEKIARASRASAGRRDQDAVSALAGLRRPALADCLAVGVLEARALQDGVRHGPGRPSTLPCEAPRGSTRCTEAHDDANLVTVGTRAGRSTDMEVLLLAHLLVLRLADLLQVQVAAAGRPRRRWSSSPSRSWGSRG